MRLASRVPGRGPKSPARTTHPQRESHSSLSLSLSPQHPPLVFEASENTMTRPPKSPPSVETGPPSSRAPPKRHPREKASRPLPSTSAFEQREKESARDRQCQGLNYSRPRRKDESRDPPSTGPPFVLPYTPHKHHTLALSHSLHPTAARLSTTTRQERRSSGTQNHSFKVYRPSVRCGPSREAGPPFTFKISMLHVFCGSHGFTHFAALFIDPRAE